MNKHIEIGTPAILPLAFAQLDAEPVLLGITLQHPPVHIRAGHARRLNIHGPRAHIARRYAETYLANSGLTSMAEIIIENTAPMQVGFGSDEMLALSVAQALAWANAQDPHDYANLARLVGLDSAAVLPFWAFAEGGVLLVSLAGRGQAMPPLRRRHTLKHRDNKAWSVNFHFPDPPTDAPADLEQRRFQEIKQAAHRIGPDSGQLISDELWPALERDDIGGFAAALTKLTALNRQVLVGADLWPASNSQLEPLQAELNLDEKVLHTGFSLTGHSLYALTEGAINSQAIRKFLRRKLGPFGGQVEATINEIDGNRYTVKDEHLHQHTYKLPNLVDGITGEGRQ